MINKIFLFIASILPVVTILGYIYYKDKYEKEPFKLLVFCIFFGSLIFFPLKYFDIIVFYPIKENIVSLNYYLFSFITTFFRIALPEEGFKWLIFIALIWKNKNFNEKYDGIIYAVFISMGFALKENLGYVFTSYSGLSVAISRSYTAVPAHAAFGIAMGYYYTLAKYNASKRKKYLLLSLLVPVIFHGTYDFILFLDLLGFGVMNFETFLIYLVFYLFCIFLWRQGYVKIKRIESEPVEENSKKMISLNIKSKTG